MATRRSLVSRGFTSVAAGPSSTNRFLKPPRAVGEYTTVAEDLRSTKNAVGPAAQPLRPRARVDTGGGGDGYSPTEAESFNLNFNEMSLGQMRNTLSGINAKEKGSSDILKGVSLFAPTPVGVMTGIMSIGVGLTKSALENSINNRTTSLTQDKEGTPKTEPSSLISKIGTDTYSSIKGTVNKVGDFVRDPGKAISGVVEEIETDLDELGNRIVTGAETIINKFTPSTSPKISSPQVFRAATKSITTKVDKTNRKQVEERAIKSRANQEILDIRAAKEAVQADALKKRNSSSRNSRGQTQSQSDGGFTGRGDQAAQDVSSQVDSFSGFN